MAVTILTVALYDTALKFGDLTFETSTLSLSDEARDSVSEIELGDHSDSDDSEIHTVSVDPGLIETS